MPGLASAKVIVIAGQSSAGTGSWLSVTELAVIRSILPVVSYSVAFDAGAARVADAAPPPIGRASIPDRLASEAIRHCPAATPLRTVERRGGNECVRTGRSRECAEQ